jgi:Ca-activated chloride channel family protein
MITNAQRTLFCASAFALVLALSSCGADGEGEVVANPEVTGLSPAGSQDFGLFRSILASGGVPGPDAIDEVGFFNEHKLDFPAPECGNTACIHALLGVMGNLIDGVNCTLLTLGLNTPLDPATLQRPPLNLVVALDVSGSMAGAPIEYVRQGLLLMLDALEPNDRLTLVTYSDAASVLVGGATIAESSAELAAAIGGLAAGGGTNIFDGLSVALGLAHAQRDPERQNRVMLLSDGEATAGIQSTPKLVALARDYAEQGIGLTVVGMGTEFDVELMRSLGEAGSGNFYFAANHADVVEIFSEEVAVFLVPVALDVRIEVEIGDGYVFREAFGARSWTPLGAGGIIEIPALFLAGRTGAAAPSPLGRRGGGGAMLIEVMPSGKQLSTDERFRVGSVKLSYTDPTSGERISSVDTITNPELPGQWPQGGFFEDDTAEKAFLMLNAFVALRIAAELAEIGDGGGAVLVLNTVRQGLSEWLSRNPDADLQADVNLLQQFASNLSSQGAFPPVVYPPSPWPID